MRTLFHGSDHVVEKPEFGVGRLCNDYGLGFYCTESSDMAKEWAVGRDHDGFANRYSLDDEGLAVVDLNAAGFCTLHWLAVLVAHRTFELRAPLAVEARQYLLQNFAVDVSSVDIVEGYRADDSYFAFAQDFLSGSISYRQLQNAMRLGKLGRQVVLKSKRAFDALAFEGAVSAARSEWLARREQRDSQARERYFDIERNARRKGDLFIAQIIDEGITGEDERLQSECEVGR